MDYDTWYSGRLRGMKDLNLLRYQWQDSKARNLDEMHLFCRSKRRINLSTNGHMPVLTIKE